MNLPREEEIRLVKDEFDSFIKSFDHGSFVLTALIRASAGISFALAEALTGKLRLSCSPCSEIPMNPI